MKNKVIKKFTAIFFTLFMALSFISTRTFAATEISKVELGPAKYNYYAGDKPEATVQQSGESATQYDIEYEYWEQMENNTESELVPVKYWYSDESKNNELAQNKKITAFEEGKSYMYSISLKSRDGYTFADNCEVFVNSEKVKAENVTKNESGLFITAIKTIKPTNPVTKKEIEIVEINNATLEFKDGDKPVFTGTMSDTRYKLIFEAWRTDDAGISSEEWFNNDDHLTYWGGKLITKFDKNKNYSYELTFTTSAEGSEEGWFFGPNTKLKVNGKEVEFTRDSSDNEQQFTIKTKIAMTPQASDETTEYKIIENENKSWTQNSDGSITFHVDGDISKFVGIKVDGSWVDSENYQTASGSTIVTLKNEYLKTLSADGHEITFVYTDGEVSTNFETKESEEIYENSDNNDTEEFEEYSINPRTGDNSNIILWISLFAMSVLGTTGMVIYNRKKKFSM